MDFYDPGSQPETALLQTAYIQHQDDTGAGAPLFRFFIQGRQHVRIGDQAQIDVPCRGLQITPDRGTGQERLGIRKGLLQRL